jgi:hypothetical protein
MNNIWKQKIICKQKKSTIINFLEEIKFDDR